MLVGGFEIQIGRGVEFGMSIQHGGVGAAGIDPDIEGIAAFFQTCREAELGGEFVIGGLEPDVGAFAFDELGDFVGELGGEDGLAVFIEEYREGHAPGALARDAPVGARFDGAVNAVSAPGGHPFYFVDFGKSLAAKVFQGDEELLDRAEDNGCFRAPAVRVGVLVDFSAKEVSALREDFDDAVVGFENVGADQFFEAHLVGEFTFVIDGREDGEAVLLACDVIVRAMAGGDVNCSGAGFGGDEVGEDDF